MASHFDLMLLRTCDDSFPHSCLDCFALVSTDRRTCSSQPISTTSDFHFAIFAERMVDCIVIPSFCVLMNA